MIDDLKNHTEEEVYNFIDNRILLEGGRNLDFEIDHRWSGIMGIENQKK